MTFENKKAKVIGILEAEAILTEEDLPKYLGISDVVALVQIAKDEENLKWILNSNKKDSEYWADNHVTENHRREHESILKAIEQVEWLMGF